MHTLPRHTASPDRDRRRWLAGLAGGALALSGEALARPRARRRATAHALKPGQSFWLPELAPSGPVVAVVNLHTQLVQLYRNGVAIGYSSASTGKPGHGTPTGLFKVLEKRRHHRSSTYDNAPMPWMVRLTWRGIAFHGGTLPGYPASRGCIRLPMDFAPRLFGALARGDTVAVLRQAPGTGQSSMTTLAPIDPLGRPLLQPEMLVAAPFWAAPETEDAALPAPPAAPLALLASLSQGRLFVLRDAQVLAAAALPPTASLGQLQGQHLFHWSDNGRWLSPGASAAAVDEMLWSKLLPTGAGFAERLRAELTPGSTLLVSELPAVSKLHVAAWRLVA